MAKKSQKPSRTLKVVADPKKIAAWIDARTGDEPSMSDQIEIGKPLSPRELVSAFVDLHNYLNTLGPTDEWDNIRQWLSQYLSMYKSQISVEDKAPEIAFRTPFIKASEPFTKLERRTVAEAQALKKQIEMQKRALATRNIWW